MSEPDDTGLPSTTPPIWLRLTLVGAVFVVAAVVATWPIARDPAHQSLASLTDNDFRFNIYVVFWGAHALLTDPLSVHHTNMFHPSRHTFAYSDMELSHSLLVLPVIVTSGNPMLTYNLLLLASIVLGGCGFFLLGRELVRRDGPALLGAALFVFNPAHFTRYQQIQFFGDHWLPWLAWALVVWLGARRGAPERSVPGRLAPQRSTPERSVPERSTPGLRQPRRGATPRWRWPLLAATFLCLHALSGSHNAVFGLMVVVLLFGFHMTVERRWADRCLWAELTAFALICLAVLGPLFWPYFVIEDELLQTRFENVDYDDIGSAGVYELLSARSRLYTWLDRVVGWPSALFDRELESFLFPGFVLLGLAAIGAVAPGNRRWRAPWLLLSAFFFLAALGPWGGIWFGLERLPAIRLIRVPSRYMLPATFAASVLATFGVARLMGAGAGTARLMEAGARAPVAATRGRGWAVAALAALFVTEALHAPLPTRPFEPEPPPLVRWLAEQPGDFAVVEFPVDTNTPSIAMRQVFHSIYHWKKLVVGYSGHQPLDYEERVDALNALFPSDEGLDRLLELDVRYAIVREDRLRSYWVDLVRAQDRLRPVRRFDDTVVYLVLPADVAAGR